MRPVEALYAFIESLGRLRESARLSWFPRDASPDPLEDEESIVVLVEPAEPVEYGGGSGVYRPGSLSQLAARLEPLRPFVYTLLPGLRLASQPSPAVEYCYAPLSTVIAGVHVDSDRVRVEAVDATLLAAREPSVFICEALVSARLSRSYDRVSSVRDCCGDVKLRVDNGDSRGYTIPAFAKCLATGRLGGCEGGPPRLGKLLDALASLDESEARVLEARLSGGPAALIVANNGFILVLDASRLASTLQTR